MPVNLPKPTICDMSCFLEPEHLGPHQFDPMRSNWVKRVQEGTICATCGEWPEFCGMCDARLEKPEEIAPVKQLSIYQCGPMAGCTDEEMHGWREQLKKDYPEVNWLDPCNRSYKLQQFRKLVDDDIADIAAADYILAYYWKTGSGSAMELAYNYYVARKPSVVVVPEFKVVSPWVRYHADYLVETFEHAMKIILNEEPSSKF